MSPTPDAFAHHRELVGKICDPLTSFFRNLRAEDLIAKHPQLEPMRDWFHSDEERDASRAPILAHNGDNDLWVFAYGSLMWDPAFTFAEVRRVHVPGYKRRFILMDSKGGRGTQEAPGLMAALDHGDGCDGLAFRIHADDVDSETEILWRREMMGPGYVPTFVDGMINGQTQKLLTFVADYSAEIICPDLSEEETVHYIATGAGFLGTSKDYLANIVSHFATLGIADDHCSDLLRAVETYIATRTPAKNMSKASSN